MTMLIQCRLGEIMRARGLSDKKLAKLAGVGRDVIRQLRENTFKGIRRKTLGKLCAALSLESLDELFCIRDADSLHPIRLHREVTIHLGANPLAALTRQSGPPDGHLFDPVYVGRWDLQTASEISAQLSNLEPGIRVNLVEHVRLDPVKEAVDRVLAAGNHVELGSPFANQFAEELVCRLHKVPPYSPDQRDAFAYGFQWDSSHQVDSSFGWQGMGTDFGIVSLRTGKLVARSTFVTQGQGEDCALIVTYRVFRAPRRRSFGLDDEFIVIAILGYSGCGTTAGARVAFDPAFARELYPPRTGEPLMRVVRCTYTRPPSASTHDNRRVETWELVPTDPDDVQATPAGATAAGNGRRRGPVSHSDTPAASTT